MLTDNSAHLLLDQYRTRREATPGIDVATVVHLTTNVGCTVEYPRLFTEERISRNGTLTRCVKRAHEC